MICQIRSGLKMLYFLPANTIDHSFLHCSSLHMKVSVASFPAFIHLVRHHFQASGQQTSILKGVLPQLVSRPRHLPRFSNTVSSHRAYYKEQVDMRSSLSSSLSATNKYFHPDLIVLISSLEEGHNLSQILAILQMFSADPLHHYKIFPNW